MQELSSSTMRSLERSSKLGGRHPNPMLDGSFCGTGAPERPTHRPRAARHRDRSSLSSNHQPRQMEDSEGEHLPPITTSTTTRPACAAPRVHRYRRTHRGEQVHAETPKASLPSRSQHSPVGSDAASDVDAQIELVDLDELLRDEVDDGSPVMKQQRHGPLESTCTSTIMSSGHRRKLHRPSQPSAGRPTDEGTGRRLPPTGRAQSRPPESPLSSAASTGKSSLAEAKSKRHGSHARTSGTEPKLYNF